MLVSIVYTYSRNGWLSLILGCVVVSIIYNWKLLFPLIAMIIGVVAIPAVHERLNQFNGVFVNDGRVKIWKVAVKAIEEHPISGIGIGNFQPFNNEYIIQHPEFNTGENILHTHNVYLKMFAELGVVGLIVFLIFSVVIIVKAVKVAKNFDGELKNIATGIGVAFFTFYLVNMFDNLLFAPKVMNYYFIFIGILVTSIINIKYNKHNS
jgi:O-antigen ligase